MRNIALRLRYDGSRYHGWQVQKNAVTVAQTLEEALAKVCKEDIREGLLIRWYDVFFLVRYGASVFQRLLLLFVFYYWYNDTRLFVIFLLG